MVFGWTNYKRFVKRGWKLTESNKKRGSDKYQAIWVRTIDGKLGNLLEKAQYEALISDWKDKKHDVQASPYCKLIRRENNSRNYYCLTWI